MVVTLVSPNVVGHGSVQTEPEIGFRPLIDGSVYTSGTGHIISVIACREPDVQEERTVRINDALAAPAGV